MESFKEAGEQYNQLLQTFSINMPHLHLYSVYKYMNYVCMLIYISFTHSVPQVWMGQGSAYKLIRY